MHKIPEYAVPCVSTLALAVAAACSSGPGESNRTSVTEVTVQRLILEEDCVAGTVNGKVGICHVTGEATQPYAHIRVNTKGCINGHTKHAGDFISDDPSCILCVPTTCAAQGQTCGPLPDGCGQTLDCGTCPSEHETFVGTGALTTLRGYDQTFAVAPLKDGRVLAVGGTADMVNYLASAEIYDPRSGAWTPTGSMSVGRDGHNATTLADGKVLVAGGNLTGGIVISSAEVFDPVTETWSAVGPMTESRALLTPGQLLGNGKVLIAGGYGPWGASYFLGTAELYDPIAKTFAATGALNYPRLLVKTAVLPNGRILIVGGSTAASTEIYDPATGHFTLTGAMNWPRFSDFALVTLSDGKVLAAGGDQAYTGTFTATAEIYDPASGVWTFTGSLPEPRAAGASSRLPDGKVLLAGGLLDSGIGIRTNTAVLFDPASGMWRSTLGTMATGRSHVLGEALPDGRVLFVGGIANDHSNLGSAEIYIP